MQAYRLLAGEPYRLDIRDIPTPTPAPDEVLLRIRAAGLNYLDLMVAWGRFGDARDGQTPFVPGTDGAGEIVAVGALAQRPEAGGWQVGERVIAGSIVDWHDGRLTAGNSARLRGVTMPGSLATYAVVPASALVRIPDARSFAEAATLPIAATTAWNAIVTGGVRPGSTVVLRGTGGVSLFALQYAKAAGARVIITSSSDEKLARAKALGADVLIHYRRQPQWDQAVLDATEGRGADLIVETVGGPSFAQSINAAAIGASLYVVGFVGGMELTIPALPVMVKTLRIIGSQTGSTAQLRDAVSALSAAGIAPVIDRVFPFDAAADAYRYLAAGGHFGKTIISGAPA